MRKLTVLERDLLFALTNQMQDIAHYLDLETGEVIPVFSFNRSEILSRVKENTGRFIRLMPQTSGQGVEMMQRFIETVRRRDLRARLIGAIKEGKVFSKFRSVLLNFPEEFRRWQRFRVMFITANLRERLRQKGVELELIPDSGTVPFDNQTEEEDWLV
ncbi:MAG: UPF0158 family protein [bacterium]